MSKELGQRSDAELEQLFGNMYSGWDRGMNVTQERFCNGETRFTETSMTPLELAARYVAAEIGANIYEIANRAAFTPITVFSQIQARLGPVFEKAATALEAKDKELEALRAKPPLLDAQSIPRVDALIKALEARAETAERVFDDLCDEIGCIRDNEAALEAVAELKSDLDRYIQLHGEAERARDEARAALKKANGE